jgi:hypothetical protein
MWTTPFGDSLFNDHPFATFDAGAGVVHHINRVSALDAISGRISGLGQFRNAASSPVRPTVAPRPIMN